MLSWSSSSRVSASASSNSGIAAVEIVRFVMEARERIECERQTSVVAQLARERRRFFEMRERRGAFAERLVRVAEHQMRGRLARLDAELVRDRKALLGMALATPDRRP